jgi:23S rRNA pseudouridine2605 synthase
MKREPGKNKPERGSGPRKRSGTADERTPAPARKPFATGKPYARKEKDAVKKPSARRSSRSMAEAEGDTIRLNKYISNSGVCSRREADRLIEAGAVKVNGKVVTELGTKISPDDKVQYGDQTISREKHRYILLNKPKGYITTVDDPEKRKTVMELIEGACRERVYPVGRLDRNTTGLLLFTNDGSIAKKLTHPRYGIKKIYHVFLGKALSKTDMKKIEDGIELEDGFIKVDHIEYVADAADKKQVGIEIHSGKNRIVRRIFEKLDHEIIKLDRVSFAGLTKKNLPRGEWRFLTETEVNLLKMISSKQK